MLPRSFAPVLLAAAGLPAADLGGVELHGFASQGYLASTRNDYLAESTEGSWEFNEFAINASSAPADRLRIGVQLYSRDLGAIGNNKVDLDWAYGDYRACAEAGLRLGRFKQPYGLYGETRDLDMTRTAALLPSSVYQPILRDFDVAMNGAQLYGRIAAGPLGAIGYQGCAGNLNYDREDGGVAYYFRVQGNVSRIDAMESDGMYAAALWWEPPVEGLRIGATANQLRGLAGRCTGDDPSFGEFSQTVYVNYLTTYILSAELARGDWLIAAEYKWNSMDLAFEIEDQRYIDAAVQGVYDRAYAEVYQAAGGAANPAAGGIATAAAGAAAAGVRQAISGYQRLPRSRTHGGYLLGQYRLDERWELGAYANLFFGDVDDDARNHMYDYALTVRYDVNPNWLVKVEGHFIQGAGQVNRELTPEPRSVWHLIAARTSFSF